MPPPAPPPFGRRTSPPAATRGFRKGAGRPGSTPFATSPEQRAAFAEAAGALDRDAERQAAVPRSFKAAFLAGLVVGCGLAGFDATGTAGFARLHAVTVDLDLPVDAGVLPPALLVPTIMLLGLLAGARAAAMTVLPVHWLLAKVDATGHGAYAAGGAGGSALVAGALLLILGHPPAHGWAVEVAAGAACGVLYRVFAGAGRR